MSNGTIRRWEGTGFVPAVYVAPEFSFADFNPHLWIDASQEVGDAIRIAPTDRSSSTIDMGSAVGISGVSALPELQANKLNGKSGLHFDGAAMAATNSILDLTGGVTVFMLVEYEPGNGTYNGPIAFSYGGAGADVYWAFDEYLTIRAAASDYISVDVVVVPGMGSVNNRPLIHNIQLDAAGARLVMNGIIVTETITSGTPHGPTPANRVVLGVGYPAGPLHGTIYEVAICPTVSVSDAQKLEGYMAWKWGVQANLPGAHPYKSAAP